MTKKQDAEIIASTRIGIIGGGQLGLMLSEAAREMGFAAITVLDPTPNCPASSVAEQIVGSLKDPVAIRRLAEQADILTYEIEHISVPALLELLDEGHVIHPAPSLLAIIQNKFRQKQFLSERAIPVAPFLSVASHTDIEQVAARWGYPLVLKAKKDAYDGRGNARINRAEEIDAAMEKLGDRELYIEQCINLEKELGVMIGRNEQGDIVTYPVVEMIHARDICQDVLVPADIPANLQIEAQEIARKAIGYLQGVGIFGVELFLDSAEKLWLNEIAPRPHNLGHYTIEGCVTSQYEQHLRAVCNLSLGSSALRYPAVAMVNILGERNGPAQPSWPEQYDHEHVFIHLYGKRETKFDRKMGHITAVGDDLATTYAQAKEMRAALSI
ncbi:MAG TPA: 5-(carboxyamino)imidazole ribonucleotide synthase [Ktedonobacteraceae bacterium]|nr:5-(carboxyamino)imidazole ribonucleotide synthase [Ktedonobacteraceae bacterium]